MSSATPAAMHPVGLPQAVADAPCFLNEEYTVVGAAHVSVLDRGFLFGDGAWETIAVYGGRLFRFDEHMARLERSLGKLRLPRPCGPERWLERMRRVVAGQRSLSGADDQLVYLQVTRGVAPPELAMPGDIEPTVFLTSFPLRAPTAEQRHAGVACVTARDFRWERCDLPAVARLGHVLARQIAVDHGAAETILFRDGFLTEAAAANVWLVKDGALIGPPPSEHVLEGIGVELLRELCEEEGIGCSLRPVAEGEVLAADELLLSSTTLEVLPVTRLDGEPVGHGALGGKPGPVYARLHEAYQRAKALQSI
jgi:D-alanine transaminase